MTVAAVMNMATPHLAIVCRQSSNPNAAEAWEPLYILQIGSSDHVPLPHCFSLHQSAMDALDDLTQEETA
jgi:hypothetical protein